MLRGKRAAIKAIPLIVVPCWGLVAWIMAGAGLFSGSPVRLIGLPGEKFVCGVSGRPGGASPVRLDLLPVAAAGADDVNRFASRDERRKFAAVCRARFLPDVF